MCQSVCLTLTRLRCAKTVEGMEVLFGMETLENPRNAVLDESPVSPTAIGRESSVTILPMASTRPSPEYFGVYFRSQELQTSYNSNIKSRFDVQVIVNDFYAQKAFDVYRGFLQLFTLRRRQPRPPTSPAFDIAAPSLLKQLVITCYINRFITA